MKYFYFFIALISFQVTAQENYTLKHGEIHWQKVYKTNLTQEEIKSILQKHPELNPIAQNFSGTVKPVEINCKENQAIFMRYPVQFFTYIDFKENRYRVTLRKIEFIPTSTVNLFGIESTTTPEPWEDYIIKNSGEWRSNRLAKNSKDCLNNYFEYLFSFNKKDNDW